jgi:predicted metal-dependent phosphoesterase TrpH
MDCSTPLEKIIQRCQELGINCIAIADHGTAEGALKMQAMAPFTVIVAEEILTPHGEIMGMFLKETIPSGLSVEETISRIKAQGGLVNIPHPFETIRGSALNSRIIEEIADQIDLVEVFNARSPFAANSAKALAFAQKHGLAHGAGSDAHTIHEIGRAYVEMPEFYGRDEFLKALAQGRIYGRRSSPAMRLFSTWVKIKTQFLKWHKGDSKGGAS